jgi:YD repeat-containing protein
MTKLTHPDGTYRHWSYDDLNRLSTANGPWGTLSYTYDIVGNRLSETVNGTATTYTIGTYNKLSSAGSVSFTYDSDGNRLTKNGGTDNWSYSYDYENRMKQVNLNGQQVFQAWYDGDGRRIKTTEGSTTTIFYYRVGSWDPIYQKDQGAGVVTDLVFAGNLRIGMLEAGTPYCYHLDRLGSIRLVTDNAINQPFTTK